MRDHIEIINFVPKFLNFYRRAVGCDAETRFALWKEHYGFAAVPPGEEGALLARQQLEAAWERYAEVVPALERCSPDTKKIRRYLSEIKRALEYDEAVDAVLVFFVGAFDGNAFAAPYGEGRTAVCLPIENGEDTVTLVHELTHLVHGKIIGSAMRWEKTVASLVFQEGLATRLSKHLVPDREDEVYVGHRAGWLRECSEAAEQLLQGLLRGLEADRRYAGRGSVLLCARAGQGGRYGRRLGTVYLTDAAGLADKPKNRPSGPSDGGQRGRRLPVKSIILFAREQ